MPRATIPQRLGVNAAVIDLCVEARSYARLADTYRDNDPSATGRLLEQRQRLRDVALAYARALGWSEPA